jgi:hypothetical protein
MAGVVAAARKTLDEVWARAALACEKEKIITHHLEQ